ncbi:caspase-8 isoform X1 [Dendroctonus ponderosae]|uniref:Caspase family p20 domain-containing protein n=1 Tax=Dendroctonus ponderosae TaxID=77166 RepID=A0AAR5P615_DENPD|nr:caspase-8 isoform X1 [Dendroctonus ponderosae]
MGVGTSTGKYLNEDDLSDDELDWRYFSTVQKPQEMQAGGLSKADQTPRNKLDAVAPISGPQETLTLKNVQHIEEKELDEYEIVALIYLLYDNCDDAVRDLKIYLETLKNPGILYKWAETQDPHWKEKFVEALAIIKNFKALKQLGYSKEYLQTMYLPLQARVSCAVNHKRKVLYLIAEHLNSGQSSHLMGLMKKSLARANITIPDYYRDYLELSFLQWEYSRMDFGDIRNMLKKMGFEVFADELESVISLSKQVRSQRNLHSNSLENVVLRPDMRRQPSTAKDNTNNFSIGSFETAQFSEITADEMSREWNSYPIDRDKPGVALIINQEAFYTETNPAYTDLLHDQSDNIMLENRQGTEKDSDRLKSVFNRMGYKVIVKPNLAHYDMIKQIEETIDAIVEESSLIICILSHGETGVVYGANSCRVSVEKITHIMCARNENLVGRPKVLILQSCQGRQCQKLKKPVAVDGNRTDGPANGPVTADLLTFWATIRGHAAIRNVNRGSWFIQALCDEIEKGNNRYHFLEICTRVVHQVTSMKWEDSSGINVMTPLVELTLRKPFYLPPFRSD